MKSNKLLLTIKNLVATTHTSDAKKKDLFILKGINLSLYSGEIQVIMGPNGSGKSTLSKIVAGHPSYSIKHGSLWYQDHPIGELSPELRAKRGLFLGFQYPVEVSGVTNQDFLNLAYLSKWNKTSAVGQNSLRLLNLSLHFSNLLQIPPNFLVRPLNQGFSGGEKKKNELLQLALLDTKCGILDEIDSGLDIDALRILAKCILIYHIDGFLNQDFYLAPQSFLLITHYRRLLDYLHPDTIQILESGKVICHGDKKLLIALERKGYDWISPDVLFTKLLYNINRIKINFSS
uniref:Iron-sulfur cluster formation ABC transporter ATP-binding subunit n=1 Tax=Eustigmatophyceae sp. Ndem 8/9T-3m6.8 TaxID=2506146 RepID=A0A3R5UA09_9STRA|nr:iron-sulfur cluster formation ABC transporter ATP-binding subunit [Eustigmatophyceae sp. Ndem 8/9T-3m6.8]QAA11836.1 iron-sulfur cluster formation ABC transporter ATP-binding subunit [Eustigmatophyceae sp. Ndem 8/9T-3m6.8]